MGSAPFIVKLVLPLDLSAPRSRPVTRLRLFMVTSMRLDPLEVLQLFLTTAFRLSLSLDSLQVWMQTLCLRTSLNVLRVRVERTLVFLVPFLRIWRSLKRAASASRIPPSFGCAMILFVMTHATASPRRISTVLHQALLLSVSHQ